MNPAVKEKWIAALRSGKYIQGRSNLCSTQAGEERHCCLGVLCELAIEEGVIPPKVRDAEYDYKMDYAGERNYLPSAVVVWSGVERRGEITYDGVVGELSDLNDHGKDFEFIADLIERYL